MNKRGDEVAPTPDEASAETLPPGEHTLPPSYGFDAEGLTQPPARAGDDEQAEGPLESEDSTLQPARHPLDESTLSPEESTFTPEEAVRALPQGGWTAPELIGCRLGPWQLVTLLGEGSWGAVFRAQRAGDGKLAAIKVPKLRDPGTNRERLGRFRREVECVRRIHAGGPAPHVVGFLEAEPVGEPPWLALELVDGSDLAGELRRLRKLPLARGLRLGLEILAGLEEAHRVGVVHRDLKSGNVLLGAGGVVRLADFGIARTVAADGAVEEAGLTVTGQQLGTLHTMSPEAVAGKEVGPPGDLYSFGALLFQVVAGRPPFRGTQAALFHAHLFQTPPRLREFVPEAPEALESLLGALLAKLPAERPGLVETRARLHEVLEQVGQAPVQPARAAVALELEAGDVVRDDESGRSYTVEREVGRGGMGIVYAARDEAGTPLALKVAGFAFASEEEARAQLIRDARNAIRVSMERPHPGVARVHQVGQGTFRGAPLVFVISELVEGPSLARLLRERGPLEDELTRDLFTGVAEGLAAVHQAGVLHLDLTPSNVLLALDPDDPDLRRAVPKLVDFGISKAVEAQTLRGVEGNPGYMSPEQCDGERPSRASDLYMWGATCYHAATGRPPFSGEPLAVMDQHRHALPPYADLESPLGHDLALVIHRCLCKSPEDRYADVDELLSDLRAAGGPRFPRAALRKAWHRERQRLRLKPGRKLLLTLLLLVLLLGGGSAYALMLRSDDQVAALSRRIDEASAASLAPLASEVAALSHYSDEAQAQLRDQLRARAGTLADELSARLGKEAPRLLDEPGPARGVLEELRLQRERPLERALEQLTLEGLDPVRERLARLDQDLQAALALAEASRLLLDEDWTRARQGLDAVQASPALEGLQQALVRRWEERTGALWSAWEQVTRAGAGEQDLFAARARLRAFMDQHPSYAALPELAAAVARRGEELSQSPEDQAAQQLYDQYFPGNLAALEALLRTAAPGEAERVALQTGLSRLDQFLAERVGAAETDVGLTSPGRHVQAVRTLARATFLDWGAAAWGQLEARLQAGLDAEPFEPGDYRGLVQLLKGAPRGWAVYYPDATEVPEFRVGGREWTWDALLAEARARVEARLQAALRQLSADYLAAVHLPDRDLERAERLEARCERFLADRDTAPVVADLPEARSWKVLGEERRVLRRLYAEEVPVPALKLRVARDEVTAEDYRVFLEHVAHTPGLDLKAPRDLEGEPAQPGLPVTRISLAAARAFAAWVGGRLPHPAEWEVLAQGCSLGAWREAARRTPGWREGDPHPLPVGTVPALSPLGIRDLGGNVSEWADCPVHAACYLGPSVWSDAKLDASPAGRLHVPTDPGPSQRIGFRWVREAP